MQCIYKVAIKYKDKEVFYLNKKDIIPFIPRNDIQIKFKNMGSFNIKYLIWNAYKNILEIYLDEQVVNFLDEKNILIDKFKKDGFDKDEK